MALELNAPSPPLADHALLLIDITAVLPNKEFTGSASMSKELIRSQYY